MVVEFEDQVYECKKCHDAVTAAQQKAAWDHAKRHMDLWDDAFFALMPRCGKCMEDFLLQCAAHSKFDRDPTRHHEGWDGDYNVISVNYEVMANIPPKNPRKDWTPVSRQEDASG